MTTCDVCRRGGFPTAHVAMSLATCGAWLLVVAVLWMSKMGSGGNHCQACGRRGADPAMAGCLMIPVAIILLYVIGQLTYQYGIFAD